MPDDNNWIDPCRSIRMELDEVKKKILILEKQMKETGYKDLQDLGNGEEPQIVYAGKPSPIVRLYDLRSKKEEIKKRLIKCDEENHTKLFLNKDELGY